MRTADVRYGSKADMTERICDVRYSPKSGRWRATVGCPLCATTGLMRCSKSIYSSPRGNPKELVWNLPAERFRRLEIVDQLELSQLNYREASRPLAFENLPQRMAQGGSSISLSPLVG